jgi:hypothetical protein
LSDNAVIRVAAVFSFLSPLCIFADIPIIASLGGVGGPGLIDFGSGNVLRQLHAHEPRTIWVDTLALLGPTLALPIGLGWYLVLQHTSRFAALGTLLWYVGMVFIIAQDAMQLALVSRLPAAYVAADPVSKPAIEAVGGSIGYAIDVLSSVGLVSYAGFLVLSIVILQTPFIPKWVGLLGLLSVVVSIGTRLLTLVLPRPGYVAIGAPIGVFSFMACIVAIGVVMLRRGAIIDSTRPA